MPEGDSVASNAARLRPLLVGQEIVSVGGTASSVRSNSGRMVGRTVEAVRTFGKNLVIDLDNDFSVLVHLGMPGRWRVVDARSRPPGSARLVLTTHRHHAACFAAPTVEVDRTPRIDMEMARLGPDVLDEEFDPTEFVERARTRGSSSVGEVLLDQRVVAGIGNVYRSELLFLAGIDPETPIHELSDETLARMAGRAAGLVASNVGRDPRSTTGERAPGRETWVYDRAGKPCRRCAAAIEEKRIGDRRAFWCPVCQQDTTIR